jgi:hypothetical protein
VRGWAIVAAAIVGAIVVSAVVAATGNGRDNTGQTVRTTKWAEDVCGTVGTWEGQIEDLRDQLRLSNYASRRNDGSSGDSVEETISIRQAVDRAIQATHQTLHTGLVRAGNPDANNGKQAALTETNLRVAKAELKQKPTSPAEAFQVLVAPVQALSRSALDGRASFKAVGQLDPALASALEGSRNCRDLMKEEA